jgi:hypothetical protein
MLLPLRSLRSFFGHPGVQFDVQQVGDAPDADIRGPVLGTRFLIARIVALPYKYGCNTIFPNVFDGLQK